MLHLETYANVLEVPADFFDIDATIKGYPATPEKPKKTT